MSNQTSASNGYVIRLEVLKMAKEMLEQDYHARRETAQRLWEVKVSDAMERKQPVPTDLTVPDFPSVDNIKRQAKELYEFISTK
jgi:hypothetical protein